jgi:putative transposase
MKKSRFTESQIVKALKENENGRSVDEISRELVINKGTFYNWRKRYGGMEVSHLKRLKELEAENARLKKMYADQALDISMMKEVLSKKW